MLPQKAEAFYFIPDPPTPCTVCKFIVVYICFTMAMCLCNTRSSVHSFLLLDFEHNLWGSRNTSGIATQPIVFPGGWSPQCISMFVLEQGDKLKEGLRYVWGPFVVCPLGLRLFKLSICKDCNTWTCFLAAIQICLWPFRTLSPAAQIHNDAEGSQRTLQTN